MLMAVLKRQRTACQTIMVLLASMPMVAQPSLEALSEEEMAGVSGRDGLAVTLESGGIEADQVGWRTGTGTAEQATLGLGRSGDPDSGVRITAVGPYGTVTGNDFQWRGEMDVGGDGQGTAGLQLQGQWDRTRFRVDDIIHDGTPSASLGTLVLDGSGAFGFFNTAGLFKMAGDQAQLSLNLQQADLFYRQQPGGNELVLHDLDLDFGFEGGTIGLDGSEGLFVGAPEVDLDLGAVIGFRENPMDPFTTSGELAPMLHLDWRGGLDNFGLHVNGGGLNPSAGTGGLRFALEADFSDTSSLAFGTRADTRLHLRDFTTLGNAAGPDIRFPDIRFDVVNAGQGADGICFGDPSASVGDCTGGMPVELQADRPAFALSVRDGGLHAFPSSVLIEEAGCDPAAPGDCDTFDWGLVSTLGNIAVDSFVYPGGSQSDTGTVADLFVVTQSGAPEQWPTNTHFLFADTARGQGIGLVNARMLLQAQELEFRIDEPITDSLAGAQRAGLRLTTDELRLRLGGTLGGGSLADLGPGELMRIGELELDLHAGLDLALFPSPVAGEEFLGFAGGLDFRSTPENPSFISLAEPSRPEVDLRLTELQGRVEVGNGRVQISPSTQTASGRPRLLVQQDILIPEQAPGTSQANYLGGTALVADERLGGFAVPGGSQWHLSVGIGPVPGP